ncbi:MAG: hypothetical protein ACI8TQ_003604, partial [Planctomycetota bacterium]
PRYDSNVSDIQRTTKPDSPPAPRSNAPKDDGDRSLIRWHLSLSVPERLATLQAQANSLTKLRNVFTGG